jgi:amino acid transporter
MRDTAGDPAALESLERLRVQRSRLADRLRPPWWYLTGIAIVWALFFAGPFTSRSFSSPTTVSTWAIVVPIVVVCILLQWGMTRATGIKAGPRPLRVLRDGLFYYRPGRPAGIAMFVVSLAGLGTEHFLIDRSLLAVAIVVAALAVVAQVALQQELLRAVRQALRDGGGAA